MEYFTFKIEGRVTDVHGSPIAGICVDVLGQQTRTRSDGTYKIEGSGANAANLFVNFSDVDGEAGGGLYMGTSRGIALDGFTGAHGPYLGLFEKQGVDAVMNSGMVPVTPSVDPNLPL